MDRLVVIKVKNLKKALENFDKKGSSPKTSSEKKEGFRLETDEYGLEQTKETKRDTWYRRSELVNLGIK